MKRILLVLGLIVLVALSGCVSKGGINDFNVSTNDANLSLRFSYDLNAELVSNPSFDAYLITPKEYQRLKDGNSVDALTYFNAFQVKDVNALDLCNDSNECSIDLPLSRLPDGNFYLVIMLNATDLNGNNKGLVALKDSNLLVLNPPQTTSCPAPIICSVCATCQTCSCNCPVCGNNYIYIDRNVVVERIVEKPVEVIKEVEKIVEKDCPVCNTCQSNDVNICVSRIVRDSNHASTIPITGTWNNYDSNLNYFTFAVGMILGVLLVVFAMWWKQNRMGKKKEEEIEFDGKQDLLDSNNMPEKEEFVGDDDFEKD